MRLLLVEDSVRLQRSLAVALRRSGYAVDVAGDGENGLWLAERNDYDAIILDVMLPKRDGLDVLRTLRANGKLTHILLFAARDAVSDRMTGLESGADDYLVKPFGLEGLLARVQALRRRTYGSNQPRIVVTDLEIDSTALRATRDGQTRGLTARGYQLPEDPPRLASPR